MKAREETIQAVAADLWVVVRGYGMEITSLPVSDAALWNLWERVIGHATWGDDYPEILRMGRLLPYAPERQLYPDDTNDATMTTARRAAWRNVVERSQLVEDEEVDEVPGP